MKLTDPLPSNNLPKPRVQIDEFMVLIEDCEARESRLSEWEREFIDSIKRQLSKGLTPKQIDRLTIIWSKATEKG